MRRGRTEMKIVVPAIALALLALRRRLHKNPHQPSTERGATPGSCGEWTAAGRFDEIYSEWVLGFISAANAYTFHGIDLALGRFGDLYEGCPQTRVRDRRGRLA